MYRISILFLFFLAAPFCYGQSAEEINEQAKLYLAIDDHKNAFPLVKQAAELGHPEAQYNYAVFYQRGLEVPKNDSIANIWLLKAATQGWKDAQFKIAFSYGSGRGVKQDFSKAFEWTLKCARQNDPECMFNVVSAYQEGKGTKKNIDSMLYWAVRLSIMDNPLSLYMSGQITSARLNLAYIFRDGKFLQKDMVRSYMWFLIYNESKRDFSATIQQHHIGVIKELEQQLPELARAKAKEDAEKLLGRELNNFENLYSVDA